MNRAVTASRKSALNRCKPDRHSTMVTLAQRQRLEDFGFHLFELGVPLAARSINRRMMGALSSVAPLLPVEGGLRLKRYPNFIEGGGEHQSQGRRLPR